MGRLTNSVVTRPDLLDADQRHIIALVVIEILLRASF